ncbi:MBL fold metallo-hydrolase [Utexia brackfieldae]|uniref:MBL fold metallo-hydrolase n=1 Tax=Utexia brackfieldae TaxID=3074108 RepID=UPI00370D8072
MKLKVGQFIAACLLCGLSFWSSLLWAQSEPASSTALFRVTLLGTGTPVPQINRAGNSTLIEAGNQKFIFDFGRNASARLWQLGIPLGRIDAFFLTHFHSDHIIGFPDFWLIGWLQPAYGSRKLPLQLYGPTGVKAFATGLEQAYASDIATRQQDEQTPLDGVMIDAHDCLPGLVYDKDGVKIYSFNNDHGDKIKPSYGYRIVYRDHVVVISGDTRYSPEVVKQATGADILIHSVSMTSPELLKANPGYKAIAAHLSAPEDAAQVFNQARPKLVILSHIGLNGDVTVSNIAGIVQNHYNGAFVIGEDLMRFNIPTQDSQGQISMWIGAGK